MTIIRKPDPKTLKPWHLCEDPHCRDQHSAKLNLCCWLLTQNHQPVQDIRLGFRAFTRPSLELKLRPQTTDHLCAPKQLCILYEVKKLREVT